MEEKEFLILVDDKDKAWGKLEKHLVHEKGLLHRAFSVFLFNSKGEMLLQQRADGKYHSAGLWTNACCGHPRFGEDLSAAVERRLNEEMGLQCHTDYGYGFMYHAEFDNGLIENEWDHVFLGICDDPPVHNPAEIKDWKYEDIDTIRMNLRNDPAQFTVWFGICFEEVLKRMTKHARQLHLSI